MPSAQRKAPTSARPRLVSTAAAGSPVAAIDPAKLMEGFFGIMRQWGASNAESRAILGAPAERTFQNWKNGVVKILPQDTLRRIGYVAGIYKALAILYSDPALADRWIRAENEYFGGQTPMQRMSAGDVTDLAAVRSYIDAARGPWS